MASSLGGVGADRSVQCEGLQGEGSPSTGPLASLATEGWGGGFQASVLSLPLPPFPLSLLFSLLPFHSFLPPSSLSCSHFLFPSHSSFLFSLPPPFLLFLFLPLVPPPFLPPPSVFSLQPKALPCGLEALFCIQCAQLHRGHRTSVPGRPGLPSNSGMCPGSPGTPAAGSEDPSGLGSQSSPASLWRAAHWPPCSLQGAGLGGHTILMPQLSRSTTSGAAAPASCSLRRDSSMGRSLS